jgi:hypothetical protein
MTKASQRVFLLKQFKGILMVTLPLDSPVICILAHRIQLERRDRLRAIPDRHQMRGEEMSIL